nr:hypothetical protein [uncultured Helicobacter sp.]
MTSNNVLSYDKRVVIENFINKLFDWIKSNNQNKEAIVNEAVNVVESMLEANALNVKELNQKVVDETLQELATKDFVKAEISQVRAEISQVRAEISQVRAEIAEAKSDIIKWLVGFQIATVGLAVAIIKLL